MTRKADDLAFEAALIRYQIENQYNCIRVDEVIEQVGIPYKRAYAMLKKYKWYEFGTSERFGWVRHDLRQKLFEEYKKPCGA